MPTSNDDLQRLGRCMERDEPFGSVLVDAGGATRREDRNRVSGGDHTRHPEFAIARCYTSGEHCPSSPTP